MLKLDAAGGIASLICKVDAARRVFCDDLLADEWLRTLNPERDDIPIHMARTVLGGREHQIESAVAGVGADQLTKRLIVKGITPDALAQIPGVKVITARPEGIEIETPVCQAFIELAKTLAGQEASFVEIAGNDDILYTRARRLFCQQA